MMSCNQPAQAFPRGRHYVSHTRQQTQFPSAPVEDTISIFQGKYSMKYSLLVPLLISLQKSDGEFFPIFFTLLGLCLMYLVGIVKTPNL